MTSQEYREWHANSAPVAAKPASGRTVPPAGVRATTGPKSIGRETIKEQPGPSANTPVRWQVATGLFAEQFGGCFRIVVTGKQSDLPAVLEALQTITTEP